MADLISSFSSYNIGGNGEGGSVVAYSSKDKKGTRSGAGSKIGSTKTKTKEGGSDMTGTYILNGYTLELRHDSDKISRLLFGFTFGDSKWIYIDGANYKNKKFKK